MSNQIKAKTKTLFTIFNIVVLGLILLGSSAVMATESKGKVHLAYGEWASNVASTNVIKAVLEQEGYEVKISPLMGAALWQATANGEVDGFLSAWLPHTQKNDYAQLSDQVVDLGINLSGAKLGLAVPAYSNINSIEELNNHAKNTGYIIMGVDHGAGIQRLTRDVIKEYNFNLFLRDGSEASMTAALEKAIENNEDIVVTAWSPHWIFSRWDLKYLDDPMKIYGDQEEIHTVVRQGLQEDMPEVYAILSRFSWTPEDMNEVMLMIVESEDAPYESAKEWVAEHPELVEKWTAVSSSP